MKKVTHISKHKVEIFAKKKVKVGKKKTSHIKKHEYLQSTPGL